MMMTILTTLNTINLVTPILCTLLLFSSYDSLYCVSIAEKKARLAEQEKHEAAHDDSLDDIGQKIKNKQKELLSLYAEANDIYLKGTPDSKTLIIMKGEAIRQTRKQLDALENEWKDVAKTLLTKEEEALWHQPDTTVGQLILDYGGSECIYLIPPEISSLRLHISSELPIPKASWNEILELILSSYGVGIKELSPFLKQLYFYKINQTGLERITDKREELDILPKDSKVAFVFSPQPHETKRIFQFLEKFVPHEQMTLQLINGNVIAIGRVGEITELLKIYDFIASPKQAQEWKLIVLQKAQSDEMAKILLSLFTGEGGSSSLSSGHQVADTIKMPFMSSQDSGSTSFKVMALKHPGNALFLMGKQAQIDKAAEIIHDIESKIGEVQEKTIYWYACKHSDADELAKVLSQVYVKMSQISASSNISTSQSSSFKPQSLPSIPTAPPPPALTPDTAPLIVNPQPLIVTDHTKRKNDAIHENFIVDQKTNSIVMVIESYILPKLQELLKKLDIPKKMVQIDILLFEKRITDSDQFGLNLLKLADAVTEPRSTKLFWNDTSSGQIGNAGILLFSMVRNKSDGFPKYDLSYKFLLSQSGIHINANPTVTTVNQTPTKIALVDEISINTGIVEIDTTNTTRLKDSFTRAQYGITIQVTPTIHAKSENPDDGDLIKFITLETDITFDTTRPSLDNRPEVARRNIKNEVRIADGETVIVGGLRRKESQNDRDYIPFLGELPGIGKLFSTTALNDRTTEMFIFITPKIIPDPKEEYYAIRDEALKKRAGDIPEFLQAVETAQENEQRALFYHSIKFLTDQG